VLSVSEKKRALVRFLGSDPDLEGTDGMIESSGPEEAMRRVCGEGGERAAACERNEIARK